jgi:hypothetical protein
LASQYPYLVAEDDDSRSFDALDRNRRKISFSTRWAATYNKGQNHGTCDKHDEMPAIVCRSN